MSDVAPPKDAFVELMAAAKDPWYTAVLYRAWLEHVDPEEPLWRVPYFGQIVRVGTVEQNFKDRKHAHETDSIREGKVLGFHAVIGMFGSDAIEWEIVSSKSGPRTAMQELANAEEIRLIAEHGGVLRDMDDRLEQTLNLTNGGQCGDARIRWIAIEAYRNRKLNRFKAAMEAYVKECGSSLVPTMYVTQDGYALGNALHGFRQGCMRIGMSNCDAITAWAESLPDWAWNARIHGKWVAARNAKVKATMATAESKAKRSRLAKEQYFNMSIAQKIDRANKAKATYATEASKSKRSKICKDRRAAMRNAELLRARPIAVPFEKSKKRRKEMRKTSTDFVGQRSNAVLYMISKDGLTIRRVDKDGMMRERDIVGPIVDPEPFGAFDADSD
mgnify:CR=1 FL=1